MEQTSVPSGGRPPVPALAAGILGLVAAAVAAFGAFLIIALGGLEAEDGSGRWWALALLAVGIAQAVGAVLLLRRRGWVLLAVASLPGLLPLVALVGVWLEYRQDPSLLEVVAATPLVTLVLTLLPPVRRWASGRPAPSRADSGAVTTSGA